MCLLIQSMLMASISTCYTTGVIFDVGGSIVLPNPPPTILEALDDNRIEVDVRFRITDNGAAIPCMYMTN